MPYRPVPWQRNLRAVPPKIRAKISSINAPFVVGATISMTRNDVDSGIFTHLQVRVVGDSVEMPDRLLPLAEMGRWSKANVEGDEIVRKDLPKVSQTVSVDTP